MAVRYADLAVLAAALPVFLIAGLPLLGYAVIAVVWVAQRAVQLAVDRRAASALAEGNRRSAFGAIAATTLARVWTVALAILLVGKLGEREDGLAAAVLAAILVTTYLGGVFIWRLLAPEGEGAR
jgi:hypothetical protein